MAEPIVSTADAKFLATLRALESGDPNTLTGQNYGANPGNGAYGAYGLRAQALQDVGAIKDYKNPLTDASNWTGTYGSSLNAFLGSSTYQDNAAVKYSNQIIKAWVPDDAIGDAVSGHSVTWEGAVYTIWHDPSNGIKALNGDAYSTGVLPDVGNRLRAGESVGNELSSPGHPERQSFFVDPTDDLVQLASLTLPSADSNRYDFLNQAADSVLIKDKVTGTEYYASVSDNGVVSGVALSPTSTPGVFTAQDMRSGSSLATLNGFDAAHLDGTGNLQLTSNGTTFSYSLSSNTVADQTAITTTVNGNPVSLLNLNGSTPLAVVANTSDASASSSNVTLSTTPVTLSATGSDGTQYLSIGNTGMGVALQNNNGQQTAIPTTTVFGSNGTKYINVNGSNTGIAVQNGTVTGVVQFESGGSIVSTANSGLVTVMAPGSNGQLTVVQTFDPANGAINITSAGGGGSIDYSQTVGDTTTTVTVGGSNPDVAATVQTNVSILGLGSLGLTASDAKTYGTNGSIVDDGGTLTDAATGEVLGASAINLASG
jgi:hypothetical protein